MENVQLVFNKIENGRCFFQVYGGNFNRRIMVLKPKVLMELLGALGEYTTLFIRMNEKTLKVWEKFLI